MRRACSDPVQTPGCKFSFGDVPKRQMHCRNLPVPTLGSREISGMRKVSPQFDRAAFAKVSFLALR
jgi:hypothetical protein